MSNRSRPTILASSLSHTRHESQRRSDSTIDDTKLSLARDCGPVIYAVRHKDGAIKIGFTTNVYNRMRTLGCGLDDLLALVPGTLEQEQDIHSGLVAYRHHAHEYYHPHEQVLAVVNQMRATFDLKPIAA